MPDTAPAADLTTPFDPPTFRPGYQAVPGEIGQGILGKASKAIYWYLMITLAFAIACIPMLIITLLIHPTPANFPLIALGLIPLGPAISAGMYAVRARYRDEDRGPLRAYWRGYKQNFWDVLKVWVPALIVLGIIAFNLAFGGFIGLGRAYRIGLSVLAALLAAWALHAITIATFFHFRTSDVARLATYYLVMVKRATFGILALLVIVGALTWFGTAAVVTVLGGILLWFLFQNQRPVLTNVYRRFTDPAEQTAFAEQTAAELPAD